MLNQNQSKDPFSGKVRVRACGILKENERILLLKHDKVGPVGHLWSPPGGGVEFGETLQEALKKEFLEETNLEVEIGGYLFTNEYIGPNHHAIEIFFQVMRISGNLKLGMDPELGLDMQILKEAKFFSIAELNKLPQETIHNAFIAANARDKIEELKGLITFKH